MHHLPALRSVAMPLASIKKPIDDIGTAAPGDG